MSAEAWIPPRRLAGQDQLVVWNALMSWAGERLPLGKAGIGLTFATVPPPDPAAFTLTVEAGASRFVLVPEMFPFAALFQSGLTVADLPGLPDGLRDALLAGLLDWVWRSIPDNGLGPARILAQGPAAALPPEPMEWFTLTLDGLAADPLVLRLGADLATLVQVFGGGRIAARSIQNALVARLELEVRWLVGAITLPLSLLRRTMPGDVFVLPVEAESTRWLAVGDRYFRFERAGAEWLCAACLATVPAAWALPNPLAPDAALADPGNPEGIAITVEFDRARLRQTVATIESWQPGATVSLTLPEADDPEIWLRVDQRDIAQGDLLAIDDRLAVRVIRQFPG